MRYLFATLLVACLAAVAPASSAPAEAEASDAYLWAKALRAPEYSFARPGTELFGGTLLRLEPDPGLVLEGARLTPGTYLVMLDAELVVGADLVDLPAAGVVEVTFAASSGLSVTCSSGYYACCWCNNNTVPMARCRRNHVNGNDCQGGGPGSTSCSISRNQCAGGVAVDP